MDLGRAIDSMDVLTRPKLSTSNLQRDLSLPWKPMMKLLARSASARLPTFSCRSYRLQDASTIGTAMKLHGADQSWRMRAAVLPNESSFSSPRRLLRAERYEQAKSSAQCGGGRSLLSVCWRNCDPPCRRELCRGAEPNNAGTYSISLTMHACSVVAMSIRIYSAAAPAFSFRRPRRQGGLAVALSLATGLVGGSTGYDPPTCPMPNLTPRMTSLKDELTSRPIRPRSSEAIPSNERCISSPARHRRNIPTRLPQGAKVQIMLLGIQLRKRPTNSRSSKTSVKKVCGLLYLRLLIR